MTVVRASIYDRNNAARPFGTIHNILRSLSLVESILKGRIAPIWCQREPTHMRLSGADGLTINNKSENYTAFQLRNILFRQSGYVNQVFKRGNTLRTWFLNFSFEPKLKMENFYAENIRLIGCVILSTCSVKCPYFLEQINVAAMSDAFSRLLKPILCLLGSPKNLRLILDTVPTRELTNPASSDNFLNSLNRLIF